MTIYKTQPSYSKCHISHQFKFRSSTKLLVDIVPQIDYFFDLILSNFSNMNVDHIRLIITSIKRQCQFNSIQYLMIYFFYSTKKKSPRDHMHLSSVQDQINNFAFVLLFVLWTTSKIYIYINTITKREKTEEEEKKRIVIAFFFFTYHDFC